ncbi:hypothetical protein GcC1_067002 [Golovinomyces cichoracearum]|uniref:Uncharacterized protein n=1 Tax=Golovinomyces cichoracearum TaxID=62708 RepID=A0A420IRD4_9PEZI|nr:hypothetical protein GcC1_067002 [Golovinomyces cichoracearum]
MSPETPSNSSNLIYRNCISAVLLYCIISVMERRVVVVTTTIATLETTLSKIPCKILMKMLSISGTKKRWQLRLIMQVITFVQFTRPATAQNRSDVSAAAIPPTNITMRTTSDEEEDDVVDKWQLIINAEAVMRKKLNEISNRNSEVGKLIAYQYVRFLVIIRKLQSYLDRCKAVKASQDAAVACRRSQTKHACDSIRSWARFYLNLGILPTYSQWKHCKRISLLSDIDIKGKCLL